MKKFLLIFTLILLLVPIATLANDGVVVNFFFSPTCPHCAEEEEFLDQLEEEYLDLKIDRFDLTEKDSVDLIQTFYDKYQVPEEELGATPATFIERDGQLGKYFIGYSKVLDDPVRLYIDQLLDNSANNTSTQIVSSTTSTISLPFIGELNMFGMSPLLLSVVVGGLDGFNACAMVALGFLLAILISTGTRRRVFIIGGTFIFVSGAVYFLFISAWLNLFLFLGYLKIITVVVSLIIIFFAVFLLKDYYTNVICKICDVGEKEDGLLTKIQKKLFVKMNQLASAPDMPLYLTLIGVALVAAGVNLIELFCSFGFPLAYTKILTGHGLSTWQYYGYLLVYIIMYMLDDFLIFVAAVITLRITKVGDKYLKAVKLISGVVLLLLGLIMLFRPELLSLH